MRNLIFLLLVTFWSCTSESQNLNNEILENGKKPYLLGKIDKDGLSSQNYQSWFLTGQNEYKPNQKVIDKISKKLKSYTILAFMGTWCGDSRREVPKFYKVLETANFPLDQLTMVAVSSKPDLYKQSPNHEEKGLNIHRVPTFIFFKNGKEENRIVEHPVTTLEEDILSILNNNYESNYSIVDKVNTIIEDKNFYKKALLLLPENKEKVKSIYELNTYARILTTTNRTDKALDVLKLNTQLFPDDAKVYMNLANAHYKLNQKNEALSNYNKAFEINPANSNLKNRIDQLKSGLSISSN